MEDQWVSFETAKLAKEKGFNLYCNYSYWKGELQYGVPGYPLDDGSYSNYQHYLEVPSYLAPTQSSLQKWLREEHNLHIEVLLSGDNPYRQYYYSVMRVGQYFSLSHDGIYRDTYEEALEIGLQKALELI